MNELEELQSIISDMHKDAYGFRPRGDDFWAQCQTVEACRVKLEDLDVAVGAVIAEDRESELLATRKFEEAIARTIEAGAANRTMAIRWLREAAEDEQYLKDDGYFEFCNGLPYGWLAEEAA